MLVSRQTVTAFCSNRSFQCLLGVMLQQQPPISWAVVSFDVLIMEKVKKWDTLQVMKLVDTLDHF